MGPRTLLATRVPPLAVEQWQLYRNRPSEKGGRPAAHDRVRLVALYQRTPCHLWGYAGHLRHADTHRDIHHLHSVLGRVPVQNNIIKNTS